MEVTLNKHTWSFVPPYYIATDKAAEDVYTQWIRSAGSPEPPAEFVVNLCKGGKKFLDLGANIGYFTLPAASFGARVLAVEALPKNFSLLVHSLVKNDFKNVTPVHAAVFNNTGTLFMGGYSAWGQVSANNTGLEVPCITIDDLCRTYDFMDVDVVKMDIEGAELAALDGASMLFEANPGIAVVFEANAYAGLAFKYPMAALFRKFEEHGFQLYMFSGKTLVPRQSGDFQEVVCADYLAVQRRHHISVPGFDVRTLSTEERISIVLEQAQLPQAPHRAYIWASKDCMPTEMRSDPRVAAALDRLVASPDAEFHSAVEAFRSV